MSEFSMFYKKKNGSMHACISLVLSVRLTRVASFYTTGKKLYPLLGSVKNFVYTKRIGTFRQEGSRLKIAQTRCPQ